MERFLGRLCSSTRIGDDNCDDTVTFREMGSLPTTTTTTTTLGTCSTTTLSGEASGSRKGRRDNFVSGVDASSAGSQMLLKRSSGASTNSTSSSPSTHGHHDRRGGSNIVSSSSSDDDDDYDESTAGSSTKTGIVSNVSRTDTHYTTTTDAVSCVSDVLIKNPSKDNQLMFLLDEVHELAKIGQNATLQTDQTVPDGIYKHQIYVDVDIDDDALVICSGEGGLMHNDDVDLVDDRTTTTNTLMADAVISTIRDDLTSVYTAPSMESAELVLCIVIVTLSDGLVSHCMDVLPSATSTKEQPKKNRQPEKAEIGLTWQLFEPDTLQVYGGGLITQQEPIDDGFSARNRRRCDAGQRCLIEKIAPRIASKVTSKIGGENEELFAEF